jgi:hypothetical protein
LIFREIIYNTQHYESIFVISCLLQEVRQ